MPRCGALAAVTVEVPRVVMTPERGKGERAWLAAKVLNLSLYLHVANAHAKSGEFSLTRSSHKGRQGRKVI